MAPLNYKISVRNLDSQVLSDSQETFMAQKHSSLRTLTPKPDGI